jgi:lambda family phage portal protein
VRGARRLAARSVLRAQLGYEGAKSGRRVEGWYTGGDNSADSESDGKRDTLRQRARDLVRNNPYATRALEVKVANTIGPGILAEVRNRRLAAAWSAFVDTCDADGQLDLYGIQALVERCRMESGEALVRFVPTPMRPGRPVAFQLRVLEPEYLDESRDRIPSSEPGGYTRGGIEHDASGRVVAYWLFTQHPGDGLLGTSPNRVSVRVPADDVVHVYRRLRAGQTRGVSDFASVILRLRDLDDYDDAEIMRKKIEAALAIFVTTPQGPPAQSVGAVSSDDTGRLESIYPGMVKYLSPGESVTWTEPKASGGYADFQRFGLRAIAAGTGVPYELMTGDLSQVNYSSYRAGLVDFRRRVEQDQFQLHVPVFCEAVRRRFLAEMALQLGSTGVGTRTDFRWTPPRFELIDPQKEIEAELAACQAGFDTWPEIVRRHGWTAQDQYDAIEKHQQELDRRGLVLSSDPRTQGRTSPAAAVEEPEPEQEPATDEEEENAQAAA